MGPNQINGIPAHVLLVHAIVVLVPLAAVLTVACTLWPALRMRMGIITPLVAFVAMVMVPVTTDAGEWLAKRVHKTSLIENHIDIADGLLPWVIGIFAVATVQWGYYRFGLPAPAGRSRKPARSTSAVVVLALLAVGAAAGSVVEVYRIGDSGAKAVWTGSFSEKAP